MIVTIRPVDVSFISQLWPTVQHYVSESLNKGLAGGSPDYTLDQVLVYLTTGQWLLLVAVDDENNIKGAMTISFINYPLNRVAFITTTGGNLIINKDTFEQLTHIAKHYGATKIQAMARPAMVRLLKTCDMQPCNTLMEKSI